MGDIRTADSLTHDDSDLCSPYHECRDTGNKDKQCPLVSIITPSFNQGSYIEDTILSVKNQTYRNIEHIVIDGGSTDSTLAILRKYENEYGLLWISEPDEGQADAIAKGFRRAHGSIIGWINTDDYYTDSKVLDRIVNAFENCPDCDVITGSGYWVDEKKRVISRIKADRRLISRKYMRYADFILQPSTFFRKRVLERVSINKEYTYVFDWLFFLEMFEKNYKFMVIDDELSAYRFYQSNKTAQDNAARKKEIFRVMQRNFGHFGFQTIYCYGMYLLYEIAEYFPEPLQGLVKRPVRLVNKGLRIISDNRVYSC